NGKRSSAKKRKATNIISRVCPMRCPRSCAPKKRRRRSRALISTGTTSTTFSPKWMRNSAKPKPPFNRKIDNRSKTRSAICFSRSSILRARAASMPKARCKKRPINFARVSISSRTNSSNAAENLEMSILPSSTGFGTKLSGVRQAGDFGHIARPQNEHLHQPNSRHLDDRCPAHDPLDPDATAEERRSGGGLRWRRNRKYFRRANDDGVDEDNGLARGNFLRAYVHLIGPVRAQRTQ